MDAPRSWYYAEREQTFGPVPDSAVKALIQQSVIVQTTWMLAEGSENWIPAHESPFTEYFQADPVQSAAAAKIELPSLPTDILSVTASQEKVRNEIGWNKIAQNVVTLVLKCLLVAAESLITAVLNFARRLKNFSYHRQGRALIQSGWNGRKIAVIVVGSIVALWLLINLIFIPIDLYEHRRGNPAKAIYPIIGEPANDLLSRFDHTSDDIEPANDGLSKVVLFDSEYKHATIVYLLSDKVVAFDYRPMRDNLSPAEKQLECTQKAADSTAGFIRSDYRDLESIKSNGDEFRDRFGDPILFLTAADGSLVVSSEAVKDKMGIQSIRIRSPGPTSR